MAADTTALHELFTRQQSAARRIKTLPLAHRRKKLKAIRQWIFDHRESLHKAMHADLQKPAMETDLTEIYPVLTETRSAVRQLGQWASPERIGTSMSYLGTVAEVHYEPKGTALIISPWNYPLLLSVGPLISAIAAGNTVILKPSEFTPAVNAWLSGMCKALFVHEEVAVIEGEADVATALLKLPFDHIFFTGSPQIGKIVMKAAAENLSSVTLELGGKSPTILDDTADVADAARKIAWAKWTNAGQTCVAPDYLMVHESKLEALVWHLRQAIDHFYTKEDDYAAMISDRHFSRIEELYADALVKGASLLYSRDPLREKRRIPPVILGNVTDAMRVMQEEIFGPVLPISTYREFQQVLDYIHSRPKPLALYLYSNSRKNMRRVLRETSSGSVVINDSVLQFGHPHLPMGGVNASGIGKAHGKAGFLAFSHDKAVLRQRVGLTVLRLVYPPYNRWKKRLVELMLRFF